jgi:hypothetical protein
MIGFIGLFDIARDYTLQFSIIHTHTHTSVHSHIFTSRYSVAASTADIPFPLRSRTIHSINYQLLTATAHNDQASAVIYLSLTHSLTNQLNSVTLHAIVLNI